MGLHTTDFTTVCSFVILGEIMSIRGLLGGVIILGAILMVNLLETNLRA